MNEELEEVVLSLLEEIMDIVEENDNIPSHSWQRTITHLRSALECLDDCDSSINEAVSLNHFKSTSIKLKDGSSVKLSRRDLSSLNDAIEGTTSKDKLLGEILRSKDEFNEFLLFAKSLNEDFEGTIDELLQEGSIEDLEFIVENELSEGESWDIIKNSAKVGSKVGSKVGAGIGGAYGAATAAGAIGTVKVSKAIANAIRKRRENRSMNEMVELNEISKKKTERYLDKAITDHGMSNFARSSTENIGGKEKESAYWAKRTSNRKKGISRATARLDRDE